MGRLRDKFPPRLSDPLYGVTSHVARRNGMVDPAKERRRLRATERAPFVGGEGAAAGLTVATGSAAWNPGSIGAGAESGVDVTGVGSVVNDGTWACMGSFSATPGQANDQWMTSAWPQSTSGSVHFVLENKSGNSHDLASGTVCIICFKG